MRVQHRYLQMLQTAPIDDRAAASLPSRFRLQATASLCGERRRACARRASRGDEAAMRAEREVRATPPCHLVQLTSELVYRCARPGRRSRSDSDREIKKRNGTTKVRDERKDYSVQGHLERSRSSHGRSAKRASVRDIAEYAKQIDQDKLPGMKFDSTSPQRSPRSRAPVEKLVWARRWQGGEGAMPGGDRAKGCIGDWKDGREGASAKLARADTPPH